MYCEVDLPFSAKVFEYVHTIEEKRILQKQHFVKQRT